MILAFYSYTSGAGKDTAADIARELLHEQGIACVRDAFADDGKVVCADALGITGTREEKIAAIDKLKLDGSVVWQFNDCSGAGEVNGREFIIGLLGSPGKGNGIRGVSPKFWTHQLVRRATFATGWTVVSDMRYVEEAEAVKRADGYVVEIVRDENLGTFNEQRLPRALIDRVIDNNGSIDDLRLLVSMCIEDVFRRAAA